MFVVKAAAVLLLTAFLYWATWVWPVLSFGFGSVVFDAIGFCLPLVTLAAAIVVIVALLGILEKKHRPRAAGAL